MSENEERDEWEWDLRTLRMDAVRADDKDKLMELLKPFPHSKYGPPNSFLFCDHNDLTSYRCYVRQTLEMACEASAVDCVHELLSGPAARYIDLNTLNDTYFFCLGRPLHLACLDLNLIIIDLLLRNGACADLVDPPDCTFTYEGLLPLNIALRGIIRHSYLNEWTLGEDSIFKLIFIMCLPQTRGVLEAIKMIANKTSLVESVFVEYLNAGQLLQAAVLLMVAGHKILEPLSFPSEGDNDSNINTLSQGSSWLSNPAKLLVEVFSKAGHDLNSYLHYQLHCKELANVSKDEVILHVSSVLEKAGFHLTHDDTDLGNIDCEIPKFKLATEAVGRFLLDRSCPDMPPTSSPNSGTQMRYDVRHRPLHSVWAFCQPYKKIKTVDYLRCRSISHNTGISNGIMNWTGIQARAMNTLSKQGMLLTDKQLQSSFLGSKYLPCPISHCTNGSYSEMKMVESQARELDKLPKRCVPSTSRTITTLACTVRKVLRHM